VEWLVGVASSIIAVIITWVANEVYTRKKNSLFRFVRKFKVFSSGAQGYYYSFPEEENKKVWRRYAKREFCYLGVSAYTLIKNDLTDFMNSAEGKKTKYRFLLMNPEAEGAVEKQEVYKAGVRAAGSLDNIGNEKLQKEAKITRNNIQTCVEKIRNTKPFANKQVEIKFYKEFLPWWIYVFDDRRIFVGLLEPGKDGRQSPLVILEKNDDFFTLYDAFKTNWDRLWENATNA
jgi:hypothetical protein